MEDHHPSPSSSATVPAECVETVEVGTLVNIKRGSLRILTLNSAQRSGYLDRAMQTAIVAAIPQIARDTNSYSIVLRAGQPDVFCAGFAPTELARLVRTDPPAGRAALQLHGQLIWMLECFSKPVIALIDGAVTDGGAGLTLVNTHRVAAAGYSFAVPAVHHGLSPHAGTALALARMPREIGTFLALTGRSIRRADALALGLITHCIDAAEFGGIEQKLADADTVDPLLDALHRDPGPGALEAHAAAIAELFAGPSLDAIVGRLRLRLAQATNGSDIDWTAGVLADIARASPSALEATLHHLRAALAFDLCQTLVIDHRMARRQIAAHDFQLATGQLTAGRDGSRRWKPPTRSALSSAGIDDLFIPDTATDLHLPTRQEMQAARI